MASPADGKYHHGKAIALADARTMLNSDIAEDLPTSSVKVKHRKIAWAQCPFNPGTIGEEGREVSRPFPSMPVGDESDKTQRILFT
jgi:hypothetical protein